MRDLGGKAGRKPVLALALCLPALTLAGCTTAAGPDIQLSSQAFAGGGSFVAGPDNPGVVPGSRPIGATAPAGGEGQIVPGVGSVGGVGNVVATIPGDPAYSPTTALAPTATLGSTLPIQTAMAAGEPSAFPTAPAPVAVVPLTTPVASPETLSDATAAASTGALQLASTQPAPIVAPLPTAPAQTVALATPAPQEIIAVQPTSPAIAAPATKGERPKVGQKFFSSLFSKRPKAAVETTQPQPVDIPVTVADTRIAAAAPAPTLAKPAAQAFVTAAPPPALGVANLPGVNVKNLYGITNEAESDEEEPPVQLASAAGLARLAPNGIRKQTDRVEVNCFKPELVRLISRIESHYGKPAVVTSGYRSPGGNKKAGGASNSLHMYCAAADIQIEGVGKWELAKYLRSMPGRGGVGTYCYTESVHVDIGSARDWNWRCRRK